MLWDTFSTSSYDATNGTHCAQLCKITDDIAVKSTCRASCPVQLSDIPAALRKYQQQARRLTATVVTDIQNLLRGASFHGNYTESDEENWYTVYEGAAQACPGSFSEGRRVEFTTANLATSYCDQIAKHTPVTAFTLSSKCPNSAVAGWDSPAAFRGRICGSNHVPLSTSIPTGGTLKNHSCYHKPDTPICESARNENILHLTPNACQELCASLSNCDSIAMHETKPWCMLNTKGCETIVNVTSANANWNILFSAPSRQMYTTNQGVYCEGENVNTTTLPAKHAGLRCPTTDEPDKLCVASQFQCREVCADTEGCASIDYQVSTKACYLNSNVNSTNCNSLPNNADFLLIDVWSPPCHPLLTNSSGDEHALREAATTAACVVQATPPQTGGDSDSTPYEVSRVFCSGAGGYSAQLETHGTAAPQWTMYQAGSKRIFFFALNYN